MSRSKILFGDEVITDPDGLNHIPQDFFPYILQSKLELPLNLQRLINKFPCFGHQFNNQDGVCPEQQCKLRESCESTYNNYHNSFIEPEKLLKQVPRKSKVLDLTKTPVRKAYTDYKYKEAKKDVLILLFKMLLGFPKKMPNAFRTKNNFLVEQYGKFAYTETKSFTTFYYKLIPVVRFWHGTGKRLTIDLAKNIHNLALKHNLKSKTQELTKTIKDKSGSKIKYRAYCYTANELEIIAKATRTSLKLKVS